MHFFTHIAERTTCTNLHHSDLDSGGQRYLEMTKNSLHTPKPRVGGILPDYYMLTTTINFGYVTCHATNLCTVSMVKGVLDD